MSHAGQTSEQLRHHQKLEAIGRLAAGVGHDFNNFLTIINGYSEVLLKTLPREDPARGLIEEIKKAGDRASEVTRGLLVFSRKQVLLPVVVNINSLVAGMEATLRRLIGNDIQFQTRLDPQLKPVQVDPGQLEQAILHVTANAREAMPDAGTLTIQTAGVAYDATDSHLPPGSYAFMAISDTGCGMDAETRSHLFEPYFTTRNRKGAGLGLATVYGIIQQSQGHVLVDSEPGRGTTIRIYLPVAGATASARANGAAQADALHGTETILLAEDEDGVRKIARRALEMFGYQVLEARHGPEALVLAERHAGAIHMLLTDAIMPDMNGTELALRLGQARPGLKVLYTSGYSDDAIVRSGAHINGTPFLQKPYSPQTLVRKVREVLDVSKN